MWQRGRHNRNETAYGSPRSRIGANISIKSVPIDFRRITASAAHPHLPSPLEGEGYTELQQQRTSEGVSSKESSCEEAPSPIIACGNVVRALSLEGSGQIRHLRAHKLGADARRRDRRRTARPVFSHRALASAFALASMLLIPPSAARAFDDSKYPDLNGQWVRAHPR